MLSLCLLALGGITVTLPMEARVRGTEITLGDIAEVSGEDPALVATARRVELGYNPAPGFSRLIAADWLGARLERAMPETTVRIVGQPACRVWPLAERITAERLRLAAEAEVRRLVGNQDGTFTSTTAFTDIMVPAGIEGAVVRSTLPGESVASGALAVPVQILVDGTPYRTIWTAWDVKVWHTVPVLSRDVRAGERLTDEHFTQSRVLRHQAQHGTPLRIDALFGSVASRDLVRGSSVTAADVTRPVAIEQGRPVVLQVRKGTIVARVAGISRDTGSVGDRVRITTVDSRMEVVGTVRSRDLVEVDLGGGRP